MLLFGFALSVQASESPNCDEALRSIQDLQPVVKVEVQKLLSDQKRFTQAVLKLQTPWIESQVIQRCAELGRCTAVDVAHAAQETVERIHRRDARIRGYAVLVGTMVGSAALTAQATASLPPSAKFLTALISQVGTIGILVVGAPIWEPVISVFRQWAFDFSNRDAGSSRRTPERQELEGLWRSTQAAYSQNAQMSRNVLELFIQGAHHNFVAAYRAMREWGNDGSGHAYAADQIAEAAVRMRKLFEEIPPTDASVARAVRAAFTRHVEYPEGLIPEVTARIAELDADFTDPRVAARYEEVLRVWLGQASGS